LKFSLNNALVQNGLAMGFMPIRYKGQPSGLSSPTTWLIIANVIVFMVMLASGDFGDCNSLTCQLLAQENDLVLSGAYWQLFTSMFVHFGFLHILFNMFGLYYFGRINESVFSAPKFLTIYFGSGLLGSVMTLVLLPASTFSGGASGAIFGLVGSYVAIERSTQRVGFALVYAVVIFVESSFLPGVNIFAHLFGLVGGFALGLVFISMRRPIGYSEGFTYTV
jgi:rhomboid protease GluP